MYRLSYIRLVFVKNAFVAQNVAYRGTDKAMSLTGKLHLRVAFEHI